ncbi:MAG: CHAD domain-containing protein [Hyphomicrobiaceae bacterium]
MAYRFKLKEDLRGGVRRIAVEQIEKLLVMPRKGDDRVLWVHEARKTMKRTRALLRCVRLGLEDRVFREENATLAGIARDLSGLRDRDVMTGTMDRLRGQDSTLDEALSWLTAQLQVAADGKAGTAPSARSSDAIVRRAVKALQKAAERLATIEIAGKFTDVVGAGLRNGQRAGRKALARLAVQATDEHVHDLRKAVQTYQRQQTLVHALWPDLQSVRVEAARSLAQLLGEAQDLAVLATTARTLAEASDNGHGERVAAACRERQEMIREVAMPLASRLFAAKPQAAEQELQAGWRAAVSLSAAHSPIPDAPEPAAPRKRSARAAAE